MMPAGGERAIEPRQRHHVEDRADAGIRRTEQEAEGVIELDLGRRVGPVAELVLQPLEAQPVGDPSSSRRGTRKQPMPSASGPA
jgi:hypothetical protein